MKKRFGLLLLWLLASPGLYAEEVGPFKIAKVSVYNAGNMSFRVFGMGPIDACPNQSWAYVDEGDSGSATKISTLLSASVAGKDVVLVVSPVNFLNDGNLYCQIFSITVWN